MCLSVPRDVHSLASDGAKTLLRYGETVRAAIQAVRFGVGYCGKPDAAHPYTLQVHNNHGMLQGRQSFRIAYHGKSYHVLTVRWRSVTLPMKFSDPGAQIRIRCPDAGLNG